METLSYAKSVGRMVLPSLSNAVEFALDLSVEKNVRTHMHWRHGLQHLLLSYYQYIYMTCQVCDIQIQITLENRYGSSNKQKQTVSKEGTYRTLLNTPCSN